VLAGPDEADLLGSLIQSLSPHEASVHATGMVKDNDKWALLQSADVSVQCSDSESFGMAVVEAMAAGTPVVVTRTCPWPDVESRGCGFWVEQSAAAIARALDLLAADPHLRVQMGQRGAAFAQERFSWTAVGRDMAGHYAAVIDRRRGGHAR
jgi:glycosyltransferase involved in cell wall biosynthesis